MANATETVKLSDGREVVLHELNTLEVMAAKKAINAKGPGDLMVMPEVLTTFAISEIDGKPFPRPSNIVQVQAFMSTVKARDYARLEKAYKRLNEEEDGEGESPAVGQQ